MKNTTLGTASAVHRSILPALLCTGGVCLFLCLFFGFFENALPSVPFSVLFGLLAVGIAALCLAVTGRMNEARAIALLLAAGFIVRLGYVLITDIADVPVRQHDVHFFGGSSGHAAYIEYFYKNWQLPTFDPRSIWQFYHPPLHHFLAALWIKMQTLLGISYSAAVEGLQFLTLFYASAAILLCKCIFAQLSLRGKPLFFAVMIVVFSPAFILFSGSVNNDILSIVFLLAAVLSALKWYQTDSIAHLLQTALFIGLGMMTKTSVAMVAFPVAALMLIRLCKTANRAACIRRYVLFGGIAFPLGLWWPIRNAVRFGVPFNYVPKLSYTADQYVGFRSFWERFTPFVGFGDSPTFSWEAPFEYNAWSGLFKSSAFGEFSPGNYSALTERFAGVLFFFTLAVCLISFAAMLYTLFSGSAKHTVGKWFMAMLYVTTLISYLVFCYRFPHSCTMNIRYATPLILIGTFFTGTAMERLGQYGTKHNLRNVLSLSAYHITAACICGFALFSVLVYTLLGIGN